jgi:hypothetical protein
MLNDGAGACRTPSELTTAYEGQLLCSPRTAGAQTIDALSALA